MLLNEEATSMSNFLTFNHSQSLRSGGLAKSQKYLAIRNPIIRPHRRKFLGIPCDTLPPVSALGWIETDAVGWGQFIGLTAQYRDRR